MDLPALAAAELCSTHGCHTVLLYGSYARGDHRGDSDVDVLGLRDDGPACRDARPWQGTYLDAFIHPVADLATLDAAMTKLAGGRVLCQRDGLGDDMLARATALAAEPAKPLPADEAVALRVWFDKMLGRMRGGDLEGDYRRAWLLYQLPQDYFGLRGLPYRGPKEAFRWLATHDPAAEALFRAALKPGADEPAIAALVAHVAGR